MHQPLDARPAPGVEGALHRLIERGEVLVPDRRGVACHGEALLDPLDDARVDAPATLPGATDVDVGLLGEEFGDGL
ncbi:MAG: hypothetical protein ACK55I_49310, partial [bacterium]